MSCSSKRDVAWSRCLESAKSMWIIMSNLSMDLSARCGQHGIDVRDLTDKHIAAERDARRRYDELSLALGLVATHLSGALSTGPGAITMIESESQRCEACFTPNSCSEARRCLEEYIKTRIAASVQPEDVQPVALKPLTDEFILSVAMYAPAMECAEQEWLHVTRKAIAEFCRVNGLTIGAEPAQEQR